MLDTQGYKHILRICYTFPLQQWLNEHASVLRYTTSPLLLVVSEHLPREIMENHENKKKEQPDKPTKIWSRCLQSTNVCDKRLSKFVKLCRTTICAFTWHREGTSVCLTQSGEHNDIANTGSHSLPTVNDGVKWINTHTHTHTVWLQLLTY